MNSSMVKPEKFDHLHLVYHFTVPLTIPLKDIRKRHSVFFMALQERDYTSLTGSDMLSLCFCGARWVEDHKLQTA